MAMARDPNPSNAGVSLPRGDADVSISVSPETFAKLEDLAQAEGVDAAAMLDRVVEDARRWAFFRRVNRQMAVWQADEESWSAHENEMRLWDATLLDGRKPEAGATAGLG